MSPDRIATLAEAVAFVRKHGVVLASAKGPVPRLTEAIVGEPITGSWWGHPKGHEIFRVLVAVSESDEVLVCRLVQGRLTLIHRRFWPALIRVAKRFPHERLDQVHEEHTPSGRHAHRIVPFPQWVPPDIAKQARAMDEEEAWAALRPFLSSYAGGAKPGPNGRGARRVPS
ncbi:MAG TPA: hypothetical protein VM073_10245 [Usitatibacter sp.]|nr:hypothetical protein [Usitatibacter sp.]